MKKITLDNLIIVIAIISLFFTFTNYVPFSAIVCIMIIFLPLYIKKEKVVTKTTKWLLIFLFVMALSALFYDFKSLFNYDFYRRDGNLFITYAPLLILPFIKNESSTEEILLKFLKFTAIANITYIIVFICKNISNLFTEEMPIAFFMFYAHNAAGGYISTLLCLSIGVFIRNKTPTNIAIMLINIAALLLTNSRGSIIGVIFAVLIFLLTSVSKKSHKLRIFKSTDIIIFLICLITIVTISSIFMVKLGDRLLERTDNEFDLPNELSELDNMFSIVKRSHTIINRTCYLWPRAMKLFTISPIIGTGFGSYNDEYNFESGITNLLQINNGEILYNDSHAHNSYLHILAETGILGFIILMGLLYCIRREILNIENETLKKSLYLVFMCIVFSSFTEHRLTTPSQVLPFTILLGLCLSEKRTLKIKTKKEKNVLNSEETVL